MKIVIYTAIFGNYSGLIDQPKLKNVDYVCFSDFPIQSECWDVKVVNPPIEDDPTRSNRYFKLLPHLHLKQYEISIYIDSNILIIGDMHKLIELALERHNMACFDHNQTFKDKRNCIYDEYAAIKQLGEKKGKFKDSVEVMENQIRFFRTEGYPENNGLIFAAVLIRKHMEQDVINAMEEWWSFVSKKSKRDQLSFNYIAWKNKFQFLVLNGDLRTGNPWFYMVGSHRKNYTKKILEYKIRKLLGMSKKY